MLYCRRSNKASVRMLAIVLVVKWKRLISLSVGNTSNLTRRYKHPHNSPECPVHIINYFAPLCLNLLKPTGHVMHQQFNIQQMYVLPTLYLCVLYLSENKQQLVPLTA